jgi:hypothetical protein
MTISPALKKLIAIFLLVAVAFVTWVGVISPVVQKFDQHERTANQSRLLIERYRSVLASGTELKAEIAALKKSRFLNQGLLVATSPELGAAILQGKIKDSVTAGAAELISVQVLSSKPEADFTRVAVRARTRGDIAALQTAFYGLETGWPSLTIDNVNILARIARARKTRAASSVLTVESNLVIRFDVYGYMAKRPPAPNAGRGVWGK